MTAPLYTEVEPCPAQPTLSVIIPSFNRCASLQRALRSLCQQDYPLALVEVIVVLDGGSDGSDAMLAELEPPFALTVIEQANQGAAMARNSGAARAAGEVLVFMDDDMEARPSYLAEHAAPHATSVDRVVIGYFSAVLAGRPSYFGDQLRGWWAAMFRGMRDEGHRYSYTDVLSGNLSLRRSLFECVGGFRAGFYRHEDYELGFRLLEAGAVLVFAERAESVHHEQPALHPALVRKRWEGLDDVLLGRMHPTSKPVLPMAGLRRYLALPSRIMMRLAFGLPALGDRLAWACERMLAPLERARRYPTWLRVLTGLMIYWYWRGVASEIPSLDMLNEFLSARGHEPEAQHGLALHLEQGLAAAAARLDEVRPAAVGIYYQDRRIGHIPILPGSELLRGRHLRPLLSRHFRTPLLQALVDSVPMDFPLLDQRLREVAAIRAEAWREPEWPA